MNTEEAGPYRWMCFEHDWDPYASKSPLASQETDDRALTQPPEVPWNTKGYGMNAI